MKRELYWAFEVFYYFKNKKGEVDVYSNQYAKTIYARTSDEVIKIFNKKIPNSSIGYIQTKDELTYQDMYKIISKMSKKQRKQAIKLYNDLNKEEVFIDNPIFINNGKDVAFEFFFDYP